MGKAFKKVTWFCVWILIALGARELQAQCPPGAFGSGLFLSQPQRCANLGIPATIRLEYENLPDPAPGENIVINIDWGDGSDTTQQVIPFDPTNPNFSISPYIANFPHTFQLDAEDCFYEIETWLTGTQPCIAREETEQNRIVSIWNTDQNFMDIEPEEYLVCVGTVGDFTFTDTSPLNCIDPGIGAAQRNDQNRWTRWIYGTQYTMDGTGTSVVVDNIGPVPPQTEGPVVLQPAPVLGIGGANQTSEEITVTVGDDATVGGIFEVRLENWNVCNPYMDNMGNLTGNDPSTRTARILIVEAPEPSITSPNNGDRICLSDPVNFTSAVANNPGGDLTYEWTYRELPSGTETVFSTAANPNNISFPGAGEYEIILTVTNTAIIGCTISSTAIIIEITEGPDADIEEDIANADAPQAAFTTNPSNPNEIWLCWEDLVNDNPNLRFFVPEFNAGTGNATIPFPDDTRLIWELLPPGGGPAVISQTVDYGDILVPIESNIITFDYSEAFAGGTLDPGNYNFGTYRLRLSIEQREATGVSECSDIAEFRILLFDDPDPVLSVSPVCDGEEVNFSAAGSQPSANIANYIWSFGDPGNTTTTTTSASTTFTYPGPGAYEAFLNVETNFGCIGNEADTVNVLVREVPDAAVQLVNPPNEPICPGESYIFGNVSAFTPPATVPDNFWQLADVNYQLKVATVGTSDVEFLPISRAGVAGDEVEFVFTNTSSLDNQEYEVSIVAEGLDRDGNPTCNAESAAITITVLPGEESDFGIFFVNTGDPYSEAANICSPLDLNFRASTATQALNPDEYRWEIRDQNNNIVFQDDGATLSEVSSTFDVDFPITSRRTFSATLFILKSGLCVQPTTRTFRVEPRPTSAFAIDTLEQECDFIRFRLTAEQQGLESYDWNVNPQNPSPSYNIFDFVDNGRIIEFTINRPEEDEVNLNMDFSLQTENSFGCDSELTEETVTINRKVVIGVDLELVSADSEGCQPFTGEFRNETDPTDEPPGTVWELLIRRSEPGNPIIETIAGPAGNEDFRTDFPYTFEDAGQFIVELRGTPPDNCVDLNISTQTVTVYRVPEPRFNYTSGVTEGCSPFTIGFSNTTPNISTALGGPVSFEYQIENTTTGESLTLVPGGTSTGNLNGGTVSLSGNNLNATNLRNLSGADYDYEVTLLVSSAQSCVADSTLGFTIFAEPDFEIDILSTNPACEEDYEYTFGIDSLSFPGGTTFTWNFGDGTTSGPTASLDPVTHTFFNPNTFNGGAQFNVRLLANTPDGCTQERDVDINLNPEIQAGFIASTQEGCAPLTVNFTNQSLGTPPNITWSWRVQTPGDTEPWNDFSTNPNNTSRTFQNNTDSPITYEVRVRAAGQGGCVAEDIRSILVYPRVIANIDVQGELNGCPPLDVDIENFIQPGVEYTWNFGDGTLLTTGPYGDTISSEIVSHTYENLSSLTSRTYTLRMTATSVVGGCEDNADRTFNIFPGQNIQVTALQTEGCAPFFPEFSNVSTGVSIHTWRYRIKDTEDFLEESVGIFPDEQLFTLENETDEPIIYEIVYTGTNNQGCEESDTTDITVFPRIDQEFEVVGPLERCDPADVEFTYSPRSNVRYIWEWGDGSLRDTTFMEGNVNHLFQNTSPNNSRNFRVVMFAEDTVSGCETEFIRTIRVLPVIIPNVNIDQEIGCSPLRVSFTNESRGVVSHQWFYREQGTNEQNDIRNTPLVTYNISNPSQEFKTYEIVYTARNAAECEIQEIFEVEIYPEIQAAFEVDPIEQTLPNSTVNLSNLTNDGPWEYLWDFGDGNLSTERDPGSHTYEFYGEYNIRLIVSDGDECEEEVNRIIRIIPTVPEIDFDWDPDDGCRPLTVQFTNLSQFADLDSYEWDFGDGIGRSTQENPTYTYFNPGVYTVSLSGSNDLGNVEFEVKEDIIEVYDIPRAAFQVRPRTVFLPDNPVFTINVSTGGVDYLWDFGDGNTSDEFEPEHVYEEEGIYDITLTVTSMDGCVDTFTLENAVEVITGGIIRVVNAFTPRPGGPNGGHIGAAGPNEVFLPLTEGVEEFNMQIFNRWGELLFESNSLQIGWDGYYKGRMVPQDVYVYQLTLRYRNGERVIKVGDVTVIR